MRTTVGRKIGGILGLVLVALVVIGGISFRTISAYIKINGQLERTFQMLGALEMLSGSLMEVETLQRGYLLSGTERYFKAHQAAAQEVGPQLHALRTLTEDNAIQRRRLATLEPIIKQRLDRLAEGIAVRQEKGLAEAAQFVANGTGQTLMSQIHTVISDMNEEENMLLEKRSAQAATSASRAITAIVLGVPAAFVVVALAGFLVARNISRPLRETAALAERMALGDLSVAAQPGSRSDEVGVLLQAFARMASFQQEMAGVAGQIAAGHLKGRIQPRSEKDTLGNALASMVANLQRMTVELTGATHVLAGAASEIAGTTSQFATSTNQTASAVAETTTTVAEVRQTSRLTSEKAQRVAEAARKAAQTAEGGRKSTQESAEGMKRIGQQMGLITESMMHLREQSQAIGQIIASVDDLAAQSNLLAVNASIEAAKAGEQGKGFAVVAQEVKTLAEQSKQATAEVRIILDEIHKAAAAALAATEQGRRAVDAGFVQAVEAGGAIEMLADSITNAAQASAQIESSSHQALAGMEQVAQAMGSVRDASGHNLESARQLDSAARNLNELGQKLQELVERYQV